MSAPETTATAPKLPVELHQRQLPSHTLASLTRGLKRLSKPNMRVWTSFTSGNGLHWLDNSGSLADQTRKALIIRQIATYYRHVTSDAEEQWLMERAFVWLASPGTGNRSVQALRVLLLYGDVFKFVNDRAEKEEPRKLHPRLVAALRQILTLSNGPVIDWQRTSRRTKDRLLERALITLGTVPQLACTLFPDAESFWAFACSADTFTQKSRELLRLHLAALNAVFSKKGNQDLFSCAASLARPLMLLIQREGLQDSVLATASRLLQTLLKIKGFVFRALEEGALPVARRMLQAQAPRFHESHIRMLQTLVLSVLGAQSAWVGDSKCPGWVPRALQLRGQDISQIRLGEEILYRGLLQVVRASRSSEDLKPFRAALDVYRRVPLDIRFDEDWYLHWNSEWRSQPVAMETFYAGLENAIDFAASAQRRWSVWRRVWCAPAGR